MAVLNKHVSGIPAGAVYIGRGSKWGNPFVMRSESQRDSVCEQYERRLTAQIERGEVTWGELADLHGKDLVCFCAPKRCHGHVHEQYAQAAYLHQQNKTKETAVKEYKLIVAGGRDFVDYQRAHAVLFALAEEAGEDLEISIVSGMARGADAVGHAIAKAENIKCYEFPADWEKHKRAAGYRRNAQMAAFADGLLAFWDGKSRGTYHMIREMEKLGKPVVIERY